MSTYKKRNELVNELLEVCYQLEDQEGYVQVSPTSKIINALNDIELEAQDDEVLIELAESYIEQWDLNHGNSEAFMQDDELYILIEAPNNWTIATTIKYPDASMLKHQLIEEILKRLDDVDPEEEFESLGGVPNGYGLFEFIDMLKDDYDWYQVKAFELRMEL